MKKQTIVDNCQRLIVFKKMDDGTFDFSKKFKSIPENPEPLELLNTYGLFLDVVGAPRMHLSELYVTEAEIEEIQKCSEIKNAIYTPKREWGKEIKENHPEYADRVTPANLMIPDYIGYEWFITVR